MADQGDLDFGRPRDRNEDGDLAVTSAAEVDLTLYALIRQALEVSSRSPRPEGSGEGAADPAGSVGRIGKFEVLGEIGRGGFGTVLRVRDPDLGRERALKVPNPETLNSPGARSRFVAEARLAARVDHPNVVRVYAAETLGAVPYIVMEYRPEGSLGQWLAKRSNRNPLPQRWVAALVAEIAEGVHQAHLAGLLHRDIKPANVLLERVQPEAEPGLPRFRPKIADFGLAKIFEEDGIDRSATVVGTPIGTWAYMSPEQARGDKEIRATTDVYAIGAILYELLTGSRLYAKLTQPEILGRLTGPDPAPSPRASRNDLHRDLETICRKSLELRSSDRYQNPSELANDLRRYLDGLPILARPAPLWRRGWSRLRQHPVRSALTGVMVTSVVAGGLAWSQFHEMKRRGEVEILLNRLESAPVASYPELVPLLDPADPIVAGRLKNFFIVRDKQRKLAAALVLGQIEPDYRTDSYRRLLEEAKPDEIAPIIALLRKQIPHLDEQLAAVAGSLASPGISESQAEAHDQRRANAANALISLDPKGQGWNLLRFQANPQARSLLIHQLGPAGISPRDIHDQLLKPTTETPIRRALIQALGEVPDSRWDAIERNMITSTALKFFRDDPDSGIHGSARWLLRKWGRQFEIAKFEEQAKREGPREGFRWRVGRSGLTFVKVDDPDTGRVIEVSDTEVPRDLFLEFVGTHDYIRSTCKESDCPIPGINYQDASIYCNKLTDRDRLPADQRCYGAVAKYDVEPVPNALDRSGYRLLTDREFLLVGRANATTTRFYGDSPRLLSKYGWFNTGGPMETHPVATLKPNEFGLFDTLGNLNELCHLESAPERDPKRAVFCGGSLTSFESEVRCDTKSGSTAVYQRQGIATIGFRVARTVGVQRKPE